MARRRRKSRKKKSLARRELLLAAFFRSACCGRRWRLAGLLRRSGRETETFVEVAPGSSAARIGQQLEAAGIVRSRYAFDLLRWWKRGTLRAGEYRFDHPAPVTEVYARIARGDVFTKAVTIPEGANIFDIAARLEQAGFGTRQDFLDAAVKQAGLVADLDPGAKSLEGYLFPDTYRFRPQGTAGADLRGHGAALPGGGRAIGIEGKCARVVTMASLMERETAVDAERPAGGQRL